MIDDKNLEDCLALQVLLNKRIEYLKANNLSPLPKKFKEGTRLVPIETVLQNTSDYDGFEGEGFYATKTHVSKLEYDWLDDKSSKYGFTHILWKPYVMLS